MCLRGDFTGQAVRLLHGGLSGQAVRLLCSGDVILLTPSRSGRGEEEEAALRVWAPGCIPPRTGILEPHVCAWRVSVRTHTCVRVRV